jgi:hypothetical protein
MDREIISNQNIIVSNMLSIEAIIAVLEKKGIAKGKSLYLNLKG